MDSVSTGSVRRAPRVPATLPIRVLREGEHSGSGRSAYALDLSLLGIRIQTTAPLSKGQDIRIEPWGDYGRPVPSRVIWVQQTPDGAYLAGIEFLGISSA